MRLRIFVVVGVIAILGCAAAWLTTEVVMTPTSPERVRMLAVFAALGAATVVVGLAIQELSRGSISRQILGMTLIGPIVVCVATVVGARSMFLSAHDTQFVIILTALATTLAVGLVAVLARPLMQDIEQLRSTAQQVGAGDLSVRSGLMSNNDVGRLGRAFDHMVSQLQQTRVARDHAEQQRKFMLASLSHDARTPLTSMRAAIEAIQDGIAPDPQRYLRAVEHDLRSVEDLLENLFVLGRSDSEAPTTPASRLRLHDACEESVAIMEPVAAARGVSLFLTGDNHCSVLARPAELQRVLGNLLANAVRHTPQGGSVRVDVTAVPPSVSVVDTGPGFPEEFVTSAFDQFTRAEPARDRASGGAGLGLAVCKTLVEQMGGRIWALPGPGGKVGFRLPEATVA